MSFFRGACGTSSSGTRVKPAVVAAVSVAAPPEEGPSLGGFLTVSGPPQGSQAAVCSPGDGVWLPPMGDAFWSEGAEVVSQRVHAALARGAQASRGGFRGEAPGGRRFEGPDVPPETAAAAGVSPSPAATAAAEAQTALQAAVDWLQANNKRLKGALASSEQRVCHVEAQLLAANAAAEAQAQRADALILQARADGARDARQGKVLADTEEVAKLREELRSTFTALQAAHKEAKKHHTQVLDLRAKLQEQSVEIGALKERMHGRRTLVPVGGAVAASAPSSAASAPSDEDVALAVGEASKAMLAARAESAAEKRARVSVAAELEKALSAAACASAASLSEKEAASARESALRASVEALRRSDAELSTAQLRLRVQDLAALLAQRTAAEAQLDAALGGGAAADAPQPPQQQQPHPPHPQPACSSPSFQTLAELEALRQEVRRLSHGAAREREGRLRAEASLSALAAPFAGHAAAPLQVELQRIGPSPLLDPPLSRLGNGAPLFAQTESQDHLPQTPAPLPHVHTPDQQQRPVRASPLAALAARMDLAARGANPKSAAPKAAPASAAKVHPPFMEGPPVGAAPAEEAGKEGGKSLAEEIAELTASVGSLQAALGAAASNE